MKWVYSNTLVFLLGSVLLAPTVVNANIVNGDFEAPAVVDGTYLPSGPSAWSGGLSLMNPSALDVLLGDPSRWPQANTGQQYVDIGNADGMPAMSQQFDVLAPGVYTLSWAANTATRHQEPSPYTVELLGPASDVLFSQTFDANGPLDNWTNHAFSVALSSGTHVLSFRSVGVIQGLDTLIDSVDLRSAAVPTPSTLSLLLMPLVALRLRRRKSWSSVPSKHKR